MSSLLDIYVYIFIIIYLCQTVVKYYTDVYMKENMTKEELLKKFGLNVKIARLKKDLTQEGLAELMDMHPTYIAKIETGKINMSLGKILELAKVLKTDINKLLFIEQ